MRTFVISVIVLATVVLASSIPGKTQEQKADKSKQVTSNQLLMRDKLVQMNRILEGLTLNKFDEAKEGAKTLGMISRATSWHITDPTPRYARLSKNFQEQTADLQRHANERNTDAATLDLVRLNVTCMQCHQHMRENTDRRQ